MRIFDIAVRTDHSPATHNETEFGFLNRSARPASEAVRDAIERWFSKYPSAHQRELRARLRSDFGPAFFELIIFRLLSESGYEVEVHPETETGTKKHPDFLARAPTGEDIIVEVVVATDQTEAEKSEALRLGTLYDQLNKLESPNCFLHLRTVENPGAQQPSGRNLRRFVLSHLANLDPDDLARLLEAGGLNALPTWIYEEGSFRLEISPIPRSPTNRGRRGIRPIGMYPTQSRWGGTAPSLYSSLAAKASKYGRLNRPYIIAANVLGWMGLGRIDVMEALFGGEEFFAMPDVDELVMRRRPDGLWNGPTGPKNTRVSGVIVTQAVAWNLSEADACLYHNPVAQHPASHLPWRISQAKPNESRMEWHQGEPIGRILGLPSPWPGELFAE